MTPVSWTALQQALELATSDEVARTTGTQIRCSRGIRGIASGDLARAIDAAWRASPATFPADETELDRLFTTSWEHGLVAIGLLAALVPDAPDRALESAERWLSLADDLATADAIGWMVLGPARIAQRLGPGTLLEPGEALAERAAVSAGLAWLPIALEGPAAAGVRARLNQPRAAWVTAAQDDVVAEIATHFARNPDPHVQKATRRLVRSWGGVSREAAVSWARGFPGGLPRLLGDEVARLSAKRRK